MKLFPFVARIIYEREESMNYMKKFAVMTVLSFFAVTPVAAATQNTIRSTVRGQIRENVASRVGELKKFFSRKAIIKGKVIAKSGNVLTVDKDGISYTVNVDANTKIRRRFYGKATLDDILVGHEVNVFGKWTDDTQKTIQATLIRDISIQKRFGVFVGQVTAISGNDITLATVSRGTQKVTVSASTKLVSRNMTPIVLSDILVGHRIRVKGMWDRAFNTITEVTQVKDYNLPVRPTRAPTPTAAAE